MEAPENTLEAFEHAVGLGYRYIETDAQLSADGIPFAFHDSHLDRVSSRSGAVSDLTWAEISDVVIHAENNGGGHLATIEELLERFPDQVFNIDAKSSAVVDPLIQAIHRAGAADRVCIASFFDTRLRRIRTSTSVHTSQGPAGIAATMLRSLIDRPQRLRDPRPLQVPVKAGRLQVVTQAFVNTAHEARCPVHVWTIDDTDTMHELIDLGVDGIMTDNPSALKGVLVDRGRWKA